MKKAVGFSAIITLLLFVLLLTGWADFAGAAAKSLREGNKHYALAEYEAALTAYEAGLEANPHNKALNFNAAQAAMRLREYEKAAQYYEEAEDSADKYLNAGNIFYEVGNFAEDMELKVQCYAQALQIYDEGMIKYPQNVPLKYNYEFVMALLDMENQSENNDQSEPQEGDENSEQNEGESSEGDSGEEGEGQEAESRENEGAEDSSEEENAANMQDQGDEEEEGEDSSAAEEDENAADMEAIQRILEMLESQEEQSLKNNQSVVRGEDGKIDW